MVEALAFVALGFPAQAGGLQEAQGAQDVGLGKGERILDAAVYVALCGKVDDAVHFFKLHK